jgi:anti-sigma factor RsiW
MNDENLSHLIRNQATRFTAGSRLRAEVRTRIALEAASNPNSLDEPSSTIPRRGPVLARGWRELGWRTATAGFTLGVVLTIAAIRIGPWNTVPGSAGITPDSLESELVSDHVRSLRVGPLLQVVSTDRHTVKPWFQGKLDYAPPVLDLADDGFALQGARVEHVNGESVAALVYGHNRHILNLFVWPSSEQQAQKKLQRKGFNLVHWADGAMQYWLVTDMDAREAERFWQLWREHRARL